MKKMKYDETSNKVMMTAEEAKEIKVYIKGFKAGATRCGAVGEGREALLSLEMASYIEGAPKDLTTLKIFDLISAAAKEQGVIL